MPHVSSQIKEEIYVNQSSYYDQEFMISASINLIIIKGGQNLRYIRQFSGFLFVLKIPNLLGFVAITVKKSTILMLTGSNYYLF